MTEQAMTEAAATRTAEAGPTQARPALPHFPRLAGAGGTAGALPIALLLLTGRVWLAVSVALGVAVSLGVCGLLFLFVERVTPLFFGAGRGSAAAHGSQLQFLFLLGAKLMFIALVGAAFLTLRHINPVAVVLGFALGQSAIVVSALRFRVPT